VTADPSKESPSTDVARAEFDALVARVNRIELTLNATAEIVAAELVGLRSHLDERFNAVDERFDSMDARFDPIEGKVDAYSQEVTGSGQQVNSALHAADAASARRERFMRAIAHHFGIELEDS
jgi:signal transduction histidine kinase